MGESGKRELRKTPEGKLRKGGIRKKGNGRERIKMGEEGRDRRGEQFPSGGEQKTQKSPFYLDFPPLGIIIYMSKEYLIFKE